jgi:hypothetical protein
MHGLLFCLRLLRYPTLPNLTQDSAEIEFDLLNHSQSA